jgi:hypothetical protein
VKKYAIALAALIALCPSCTVKTVFYDVNPDYESHAFKKETIAICPYSGKWKIKGADTMFARDPDAALYPDAVAREIGKRRACLNVTYPGTVAQKIPEIEALLAKHKNSYRKIDTSDSAAYALFRSSLEAEYLLFFESIVFSDGHQARTDSVATGRNISLLFQVWDLKNLRFMYRGETTVSGDDSRGSRMGTDFHSNKWNLQNTAYELVKSLPICK